VPYTAQQAADYARAVGTAFGLREDQLPEASQMAAVLNGLEECQAAIQAMPQERTPLPIVEFDLTPSFRTPGV